MLRQQLRLSRKAITALLVGGMLSMPAFAENNQREIDVTVSTQEGDQTALEEQTFVIDQQSSIQDILVEMGLMDELGQLKDGETLEITVKRSANNVPMQEIEVDFKPRAEVIEHELVFEQKAFLGVRISTHRDESGTKVLVEDIIPGTAAHDAGILANDVIVSIEGTPAVSVGQAVEHIQSFEPGTKVEVVIERDGALRTLDATLGKKQIPNREMFRDVVRERITKERLSRAIRSNQYQDVRVFEAPARPFLGIYVGTPADNQPGVLVKNTIAGTTAEDIGLQQGDVIKAINDKPIANNADLRDVLNSLDVDDNVVVSFMRDGSLQTAEGSMKIDKRQSFSCKPPVPSIVPVVPSFPRIDTREVTFTLTSEALSDVESQEMESATGESFAKASADDQANMFYPNPNSGVFTVNHTFENSGDVSIQVFDVRGTEVYSESISDFSGQLERTLDISDFGSGTYFVRIEQNDNVYTRKIVATK